MNPNLENEIIKFLIECSQMQDIERRDHYSNRGLTELQHKVKTDKYRNEFIAKGNQFLEQLLTVKHYISDISEKRIKLNFPGDMTISYQAFGISEMGINYNLNYSERAVLLFKYNPIKFRDSLLGFPLNCFASITGKVIGIKHCEGNILCGCATDISFIKDNYDKDDSRFVVYLDLLSIEEELPPKKNNCFIATACYGNNNAEEVLILRKFRDNVLLNSTTGQTFVNFYAIVSPPIARIIEKSSILKSIIRNVFLAPIIRKIKKKQ